MRRDGDRVCYLHFGPHKTGSTSIQAMLRERARALGHIGVHVAAGAPTGPGREASKPGEQTAGFLGRFGVLLRDGLGWGPVDPGRGNHSYLGVKSNFEGRRRLEDAPDWRRLSEDIANHSGPVVISGENIFRRIQHPQHYGQIVDFFLKRDYRLKLIGYVRDQVGWINSHYVQHIKNLRSSIGFRRYLDQVIAERQFEFEAMFANPLADDRVDFQVVSFEAAIRAGLERDFLNRIGGASIAHVPRRIANPNFGAKGVYVARAVLRRHGGELDSAQGLRRALDLRLREVALARGWEASPYMGFDEESARGVRDHFQTSNDAFSRRMFGRSWSDVAGVRLVSRNEFDPKSATADERREVEETVTALGRMIAGRLAKG